jgi:polysaccharide export outer membrane protein
MTELSADLEQRYLKEIKNPGITVSAVTVNTRLEEFRNTVDNRAGIGGQSRRARVTPAGTVQLPAIGSVPAQGLTVEELKREIEAAYSQVVSGLEVTPILEERAPRFVYVLGEVTTPGRYTLEGPTTIMQAIALAEGWKPGAKLRHVIVFRRDDNWDLMAARVDIHDALYDKDPCPAGEIWLRDSDIVLVPKRPIQVIDDAIELVFTRGIYGVYPVFTVNGNLNTIN